MIAKIFTGPAYYSLDIYIKDEDEFIIGADQGAYLLAKNGISFDLAVGDFDSVSPEELICIRKYAKEVQSHSKTKDYTDTYLAVLEALKHHPSEIVIYGGIGGRFDHSFANLNLLKFGNITIITEDLRMYLRKPGTYQVNNNKKYISFFALEPVLNLSLKGFKFELNNIELKVYNPLCISNEGSGELSFTDGLLLVMHQDENK